MSGGAPASSLLRHPWVHASLALSIAFWGLTFIGVHELLPYLDAPQIVTMRFILISAAFAFTMAVVPSLRPRFTRAEWGRITIAAIAGVPGAQLAVVHAQRYLSPSLAALVVTTSPAFAAVFAALLLDERLRASQIVGLFVSLCGVALVILFGTGEGAVIEISDALPASLILLTPIAWALYTVLSKPLAARHPPLSAIGASMVVGTLFLLPLVPHTVDGVRDIGWGSWGWLAYMAIGGTLIPYVLWFTSLKVLPATTTMAYMYLVPVMALFWGAVILGTLPTPWAYLGGALVFAGLLFTQVTAPTPDAEPEPEPSSPVVVASGTEVAR